MTELERFFRRLVANLADSDPARLHRPIPLEDIHESIVPYRTNRRALLLDSSEDYEMVLLRLCAGEGGFVRTDPEEARARFDEELQSPNPDLGVLHRQENVVVSLRSEPLARALSDAPDPDLSYAPTPSPLAGLDLPTLDRPLADELEELTAFGPPDPDPETVPVSHTPRCLYCGDALPPDRPVRFCPHCGQRQTPPECPRCHSEVEPGWRHCVSCGTALAEG
ncbi:MAG TPA: zinc ribbon domain-containing protein [Gemmatimonadales bacterium]|nr:zinc ribbon domain-containing protein [Gemmatimonadales bacterium]